MSTAAHSIALPAAGQRPMAGILDSRFKYRPSFDTDLARTFKRIRREMKAAAKRAAPAKRGTRKAAKA